MRNATILSVLLLCAHAAGAATRVPGTALDSDAGPAAKRVQHAPASTSTPAQLGGGSTWAPIGPFGAMIHMLHVSPLDPNLVLATTPRKIFRSTDGGVSWSAVLSGQVAATQTRNDVAFSTTSAGEIFAIFGFDSLYRSADSGATWTKVQTLVDYDPDDDFYPEITAVAVDPDNDGHLYWYASSRYGDLFGGYRFESTDHGATFQGFQIATCDFFPPGVRAAAYDQSIPRRRLEFVPEDCSWSGSGMYPGLHAFTSGGGYQYVAGIYTDPLGYYDRQPAALAAFGATVYLQIGVNLDVSTDGGASWKLIRSGITGFGARGASDVFVAQGTAVARSGDAGTTWQALATDVPGSVASSQTLAVAPLPGTAVLAGSAGGVARSGDDGDTFVAANAGMLDMNVRALAVAGDADEQIWAGSGEPLQSVAAPGLYRTTDGGASWIRSDLSHSALFVRDVAVDATTLDRPGGALLYASGVACNYYRVCNAATGMSSNAGIYRSVDGGLHWSAASAGLPSSTFSPSLNIVRAIAVDPAATSPEGNTRVLAGTGKHDGAWLVTQSADQGIDWGSTTGLPNTDAVGNYLYMSQLAFAPGVPGLVYGSAILNAFYDPATVPSGVFKSTDSGATWSSASSGLPVYPGTGSSKETVYSVVSDPEHPQWLWAATEISDPSAGTWRPAVFRSRDGGQSWEERSVGLPAKGSIRMLAFDPGEASTIYAADVGFDADWPGGVWMSEDGGDSWARFGDPIPQGATEIVVHGDRLFVGTLASGVYRADLTRNMIFKHGFE